MRDFHLYTYSKEDIASEFDDELFRSVIRTPAFTRLKHINFLGAIDYLQPGGSGVRGRHTRFDHSLAVGSLALRYSNQMGFQEADRRLCVVAALLHDIGHAPLSHSLESVFKSVYELDHHVSGERIIRGDVPLGAKLRQVLEKFQINIFRVLAVIEGKDEPKFNALFGKSINVDTAEAIPRSAKYIYRNDLSLSPVDVIDALVNIPSSRSTDVLDQFWRLKDEIYSKVIQTPVGIIADLLCKRYMEKNKSSFKESYYYGTEKALRADHKELFIALSNFSKSEVIPDSLLPSNFPVDVAKRSFIVDGSVSLLSAADLDRRYIQKKTNFELKLKKHRGEREFRQPDEHKHRQDLFE